MMVLKRRMIMRAPLLVIAYFICSYEVMLSHRIETIDYWQTNLDLMKTSYINKAAHDVVKEQKENTHIFALIERVSPRSLIEVGCGFGYTVKKIAQQFPQVECYGADWSDVLIKEAQSYCKTVIPQMRLRVADAAAVHEAFGGQSFDLLVTHGCLMCMDSEKVRQSLQSFKKVAKYILLMEVDYTHLEGEALKLFFKERSYPRNDYQLLIKDDTQLSIIEKREQDDLCGGKMLFLLLKVE